MRLTAIGLLCLLVISAGSQSLQPVGSWREHLPYNSAIDVTSGNGKIWCATPYSLFSVDLDDNDVERYSRITGLNETGISAIRYDENNNRLFIAYTNSNIDLIAGNKIINIPDIKRDNISGDKTIYNILPYQDRFFLSTGIGIIIIDGSRYEVDDTWFIGNNGGQVKVNGIAITAAFYYAATQEGLKRVPISSPDPANHLNWTLLSGANGLSRGPVANVHLVGNNIIAEKNDSLFILQGSNWNLFFTDGWPWTNTNVNGNLISICERQANGSSRIVVLNSNGTINRVFSQPGVISMPEKSIRVGNDDWTADRFGGLSRYNGSSFQQFKPNSPESVSSGEMQVSNGILYATAGSVNDSWNYLFNSNGFFYFKEGVWTNINRFLFPQIDSLLDHITIAIDPRDGSIWTGSYGGGLLHTKDGPSFEIFKQGFLGETIGDPGSYRVSGLKFDANSNLWISNYGAAQPLRVRKADQSWVNFTVPYFLNENALSEIIIDDNNFKWIVSPKGNGLIVFDHANTIENIGDDRWRLYRAGSGIGNLPSNEVLTVEKDKNGYIWIGTDNGIGVVQCPHLAFSSQGCDAVRPVVTDGAFPGFLFEGEEVRDIAVDGADRKWIATGNGAWLINAEGTKVLHHFTEENSPILSNEVHKITIDGLTGEVVFATAKGICSFRGSATEGSAQHENVLVFPNPVPPGYSGTIAIRGLADNSIVKITEMNGRLVYQARSLGGQAIWNGKDYNGRSISSGVYLVLISNPDKTEKTAAKIIFISK